jgi:mediator of RNA polymerase II transcription subunit 12, fungi type
MFILHGSLKLLRTFYLEGLVDNRSFLSWLVQQMGCSNLAQAGFLARLADEYLDDMLSRRALSRPFVDACLAKISEVRPLSFVPSWLTNVPSDPQYTTTGISSQP